MNDKTQYIEGLRRLATNIKLIESYHTYSVWAGRHAMNSGLTFYEVKDHPDIKAWRQFKDDIVVELDAAIKIGLQDYESDLASCRKLSIELSQGFYRDGSPLIFEAITEVTALADRLEYSTKVDGSKDTSIANDGIDTPHLYKLYFAEYRKNNPRVKYPKAAAAKAYWDTKLDKDKKKDTDEAAFIRSFKYYIDK